MTHSGAPLRLVLIAQPPRGSQGPPLLDFIRRSPEYRERVRPHSSAGGSGLADATIVAVLAQGALLGLFRLLKAWVEAHRTNATVRVRVNGSDVEIKVDGRAEPTALVSEAMRVATRAVGPPGRDDQPR
jgi:membrane-associated two-gene conflict system component 1 (EACC1)